jgi:hypothetical protein
MMHCPQHNSLRLLRSGVAAAALCAVAASCSNSSCIDNQNALPLAGFYASSTGEAASPKGLAVGGVGAPNDSLLKTASSTASTVYLPFRAADSSTAFAFTLTVDSVTTVTDTITFAYSSTPYYASAECGAMYCYHITDVAYTTAFIDSVSIIDSLVTNVDLERIKIYLRDS